ncbi:MAG TPA: hypothetical protein VJR92_13845 [Gemmatimonadaceae bacterium]|nr:hypothetical protein [Gemmatimonadaceae bacterium]
MARPSLRAHQEQRGRDTRARDYVRVLMSEPHAELVARVAAAGDRDDDHARWEIRYARRAVGLLVAERDALNDLTSSDVAAALAQARESDPNIASDRRAVSDRQFNDRLSAYRAAMHERGAQNSSAERLAAVLLRFSGASEPRTDDIRLACETMSALVSECNEALRSTYGEVSLPRELQ